MTGGASAVAAGDAWALIACTSTSWHNYRHVSNALAVYHAARHMGIPDERIVLMLAGSSVPCNPRNSAPGSMFHSAARALDLYPPDVQVDYRGSGVTVEAFLRVLTDRLPAGTPAFRRLRSSSNSSVLVYLAGHGGDGFLKFRDHQELTARELADGLGHMQAQRRYKELLLLLDTCQAASLTDDFDALEGVLSLSASSRGENSYSLETDHGLGVAVSDRFTFHLHRFLVPPRQGRQLSRGLAMWLRELEATLRRSHLMSQPVRGEHGWRGSADQVRLERFFGVSAEQLTISKLSPPNARGATLTRQKSGALWATREPAGALAAWQRAEEAAYWGVQLPSTPLPEPVVSPKSVGVKGAVLMLPLLQAMLLLWILLSWPCTFRTSASGDHVPGHS